MTDEKWEDLIGRVKDTFTLLEQREEPLEDSPGVCKIIIFDSPLGKIKMEYVTRPVIVDTRGVGSGRTGSTSSVTHHYSDSEQQQFLRAFRMEADAWVPISAEQFQ